MRAHLVIPILFISLVIGRPTAVYPNKPSIRMQLVSATADSCVLTGQDSTITMVLRRTPLKVSLMREGLSFDDRVRFYKWEVVCMNVAFGPNHIQSMSERAYGRDPEVSKMKILVQYLTTTKLWPSKGRTPYIL